MGSEDENGHLFLFLAEGHDSLHQLYSWRWTKWSLLWGRESVEDCDPVASLAFACEITWEKKALTYLRENEICTTG